MSNYNRVIPRDFFNEAKLLKCMGFLALNILNGTLPDGINVEIEEPGEPFDIHLMDDGSLYIANYMTTFNNVPVIFKTTYNSKDPYPFFLEHDYCDYKVFNDDGTFSNEFKSLKLY